MLKPEGDSIPAEFDSAYLELVRLLHEAAEVEHALMLQYLYGSFSLKPGPAFAGIRGEPVAAASTLLGVAVQEMQHLHTVNELLVRLGAAPNVARQDFPYEPDVYPFELSLEPLSLRSLAKYTYAEAARDELSDSGEAELLRVIDGALGDGVRPNHVGSLYQSVREALDRFAGGSSTALPEVAQWRERIEAIRAQGERDHFRFFRALLLGESVGGPPNPWLGHPGGDAYPALALPVNPTAFRRHPNQILDPVGRDLAWLGDLHYWIVLALLDLSYRYGDPADLPLALRHMRGPISQLGTHLAAMGIGLPFDPCPLGPSIGRDEAGSRTVLAHLVREAQSRAKKLVADLPAGFDTSIYRESRPD